jgi:anaerobic selenocysteine-containing dehydrogenase
MGRYDIDWDGMVADYGKIREKIEVVFPDFANFNARILAPGGFRLDVPASRREWKTQSRKANFLVAASLDEDPRLSDPEVITLATIRSHDQYNTTIYGFDDRYRSVFGRRDILFMNEKDLNARGLQHGDLVEIEAVPEVGDPPGTSRVMRLTAVAFEIPLKCAAAYYPEANVLVPLTHYDRRSGTPGYKSIPIRVRPPTNSIQSQPAMRQAR